MTHWDYGRCKSLLEEAWNGTEQVLRLLERHSAADLPVRSALQDVDKLFNALRKVKALLVRDRKSKA